MKSLIMYSEKLSMISFRIFDIFNVLGIIEEGKIYERQIVFVFDYAVGFGTYG